MNWQNVKCIPSSDLNVRSMGWLTSWGMLCIKRAEEMKNSQAKRKAKKG